MAKTRLITHARLLEVLNYDPETGEFRWRSKPSRPSYVGRIAGTVNNFGYRQINIDGRMYSCHRLAFLYINGIFPELHIDHKDRNKSNNAWRNLREATPCQNMMNLDLSVKSTSGHRGVVYDNKSRKWRVRFNVNSERLDFGCYDSFDEAKEIAIENSSRLRGEFAG